MSCHLSGVDAYEIFRKIEQGEIRGLLSICFNPLVSLPDNNFVRRMLEKLEFYVAIDFFLNETARHADIVLPGSLQEEDEGTVTQIEGRVIKINKAVDCPGDARQDWRIIQDIAAALKRPHGFTFHEPREIFNELRQASRKAAWRITRASLTRRSKSNLACSGLARRTITPARRGCLSRVLGIPSPKGRGRFIFLMARPASMPSDYAPPTEDVDAEYPVILTTGRVVSQFLSGTQTRRIGPLVDQYPEPLVEMHPQLAERLGIQDGDWVTVESRRGSCTLKAQVVRTIRPDTVFIPYHWAGPKSANQLTIAAQDPISKIPEYKVCAVRVRKAEAAPEYAHQREPQQ